MIKYFIAFSFLFFANGPAKVQHTPKILIVFIDDGSDAKARGYALKNLPKNVVLALSQNIDNLKEVATEAKNNGINVILSLNLAGWGLNFGDPGRNALWPNLNSSENIRRIDYELERIGFVDGVLLFGGGAFFEKDEKFAPIAKHLQKKGLPILDPNMIGFSKFFTENFISAQRIWLDDNIIDALDESYVAGTLRNRFCVVGFISKISVDKVNEWLKRHGPYIKLVSPVEFLKFQSIEI